MTDTTADMSLETTMSPEARNLLGRMSPAERAAGRFLRAPDGHDGDGSDGGGNDDAGDGDGSDAGASGADAGGGAGADDGKGAGDDKGSEGAEAKGEDGADKSLMGQAGEKADEPDPAKLPPEKYELAAPEGFQIDAELQATAEPVFRELGLTNDQANKLMPLVPAFAERLVQQQTDAHRAMTADWAKEAKADKEIGGANWSATEGLVAKALDRFAGPAVTKDASGAEVRNGFRDLLDSTGLGNHPAMIRMFRDIGRELGDGGSFARSDAGAPVKKTREEVLYGAKEN